MVTKAHLFSPDEYSKLLTLEDKEIISILQKALEILGKVGAEQLDFIDEWKEQKNDGKTSKHLYVFTSLKDYWEAIDFIWFLGDTDYRHYATMPARLCEEIFLKFNFFCKLTPVAQDEISVKELLKSAVRNYKRDKLDGNNQNSIHLATYNLYKDLYQLPDIDNIHDETREPKLSTFPGIKRLITIYQPEDFEVRYFLYQYLCDNVHGSIMGRAIREATGLTSEYRRVVMDIYMYCKDILVLADNYFFNSNFKDKVLKAISEADNMFKNSVKDEKSSI